MRLFEVTNESRKIIKRLQNMYIRYSLNSFYYVELIDYLQECKRSQDPDIIKEADLIKKKLQIEVLGILSK